MVIDSNLQLHTALGNQKGTSDIRPGPIDKSAYSVRFSVIDETQPEVVHTVGDIEGIVAQVHLINVHYEPLARFRLHPELALVVVGRFPAVIDFQGKVPGHVDLFGRVADDPPDRFDQGMAIAPVFQRN